MGEGTDAITNAGSVTKPVQQGFVPQDIPSFGKTVAILAFPPGVVSNSVPIDKKTLLDHYGVV
jgi:hypothetical protein